MFWFELQFYFGSYASTSFHVRLLWNGNHRFEFNLHSTSFNVLKVTISLKTLFQWELGDFASRKSKVYITLQFIPEQLLFVVRGFHLSVRTVQDKSEITRRCTRYRLFSGTSSQLLSLDSKVCFVLHVITAFVSHGRGIIRKFIKFSYISFTWILQQLLCQYCRKNDELNLSQFVRISTRIFVREYERGYSA
jgi:hypothetical protein